MPTSYRLPDDIQAKIKKLAKKHYRSENSEVVYALSLYIQRCEDEEASEHENDLSPEELAAECAILHPGLTYQEYEASKKGHSMQNITITADVVKIMRGHHQGLVQDGNTISFKAKEKAQFGPLGAWYYLLPDNTIVEYVEGTNAISHIPSTIQSFLGRSWKELKGIEAKRVAK